MPRTVRKKRVKKLVVAAKNGNGGWIKQNLGSILGLLIIGVGSIVTMNVQIAKLATTEMVIDSSKEHAKALSQAAEQARLEREKIRDEVNQAWKAMEKLGELKATSLELQKQGDERTKAINEMRTEQAVIGNDLKYIRESLDELKRRIDGSKL